MDGINCNRAGGNDTCRDNDYHGWIFRIAVHVVSLDVQVAPKIIDAAKLVVVNVIIDDIPVAIIQGINPEPAVPRDGVGVDGDVIASRHVNSRAAVLHHVAIRHVQGLGIGEFKAIFPVLPCIAPVNVHPFRILDKNASIEIPREFTTGNRYVARTVGKKTLPAIICLAVVDGDVVGTVQRDATPPAGRVDARDCRVVAVGQDHLPRVAIVGKGEPGRVRVVRDGDGIHHVRRVEEMIGIVIQGRARELEPAVDEEVPLEGAVHRAIHEQPRPARVYNCIVDDPVVLG